MKNFKIYICIYMYICMYIYIYVYIYMCIYIYIYTQKVSEFMLFSVLYIYIYRTNFSHYILVGKKHIENHEETILKSSALLMWIVSVCELVTALLELFFFFIFYF